MRYPVNIVNDRIIFKTEQIHLLYLSDFVLISNDWIIGYIDSPYVKNEYSEYLDF